MKLGILSDTHAAADITRRAVALLLAEGAEYLVHCGDVGDEAVLDALAGVPSSFVFGNCDNDRRGLQQYAESIGINCMGITG
ncbi:MAG TPA: metallophosphoesterase family protein, partial [Tepidisphaeraceae bacterium]